MPSIRINGLGQILIILIFEAELAEPWEDDEIEETRTN